MPTMREAARKEWNTAPMPTIENINLGSLQRIADSLELIARNYGDLITERDRYKKWYQEERGRVARLGRRLSALKGVITKMKKARG